MNDRDSDQGLSGPAGLIRRTPGGQRNPEPANPGSGSTARKLLNEWSVRVRECVSVVRWRVSGFACYGNR